MSDGKTVRCGCVLHEGKDHSRVRGCPSVYIDNLLEANAELAKALLNIRDSLDYLFTGKLDKYIE